MSPPRVVRFHFNKICTYFQLEHVLNSLTNLPKHFFKEHAWKLTRNRTIELLITGSVHVKNSIFRSGLNRWTRFLTGAKYVIVILVNLGVQSIIHRYSTIKFSVHNILYWTCTCPWCVFKYLWPIFEACMHLFD